MQLYGVSLLLGILIVCLRAPVDWALKTQLVNGSSIGHRLGAVMMLVSDWRTKRYLRKCHFNTSMDALVLNWRPHNNYPVVLMDTKEWVPDDISIIRSTWRSLDFIFLNVGQQFDSAPAINRSELADEKAPKSDMSYKRMCHFFFKGFTQVPELMLYKYLFRLDDDTCLLDPIQYDVFKLMEAKNAAYAYSHIWYDKRQVTEGMYQFVHGYVGKKNITFQNPVLHKAVTRSKRFPRRVPCYNTNFEVINTVRYRDAPVMEFVDAVVESNLIFHRRWGDAPLRFSTVMLFFREDEVVRIANVSLIHSSWPVLERIPARNSSDPELFM